MKTGKIVTSTNKPEEGFIFRREGYEIYISYIEPNSIKEIEKDDMETKRTEYECVLYSYYGAINSYEALVSKAVALKYSIEEEMSLISKAIADPTNLEYVEYRKFVEACKEACKENYLNLGLNRNEK